MSADPNDGPGARWKTNMRARSPDEPHRAATPLELFFDLVFVVAIAQAAAGLHHAIAADHVGDALAGYAMVFFAIWWAWMNFTWFASAYDSDDVPYRLTVFVQLTGALVLAAGVPAAFAEMDLAVATFGYVLMRVAMVAQWIRAGRADPERRATTLRYAVGIAVVQFGWVGLLAVPDNLALPGFVTLVVLELAIPVWAESASATTWHAHHIAERYGLLTIIVLGESILAATMAIEAALTGGGSLNALLPTIVGGLLTLYAMWWLYFDRDAHELLSSLPKAFLWGYGHYLIYASAAAVGAGLAVMTDVVTDHAEVGMRVGGAAVALPAALFLLVLWLLHGRTGTRQTWEEALAPVAVVLVALSPFTRNAALTTGIVLTLLLGTKIAIRHRRAIATA